MDGVFGTHRVGWLDRAISVYEAVLGHVTTAVASDG